MSADPLVHVAGLVKAFGRHLVLDAVTLEVRPGQALAALARPTRGVARVAGFDCVRQAAEVRARVGVLGHGAWVYEDLTALENLRFWATLGGLDAGGEALRAALAPLELDRVADTRV